MHEQFQPRRDNPPSRQPQRERPKGFVLHEQKGLEEHRIVPMMEEVKPEQLAVDRIAQRIVQELSADRGRLREPEAAMQNMLARAIIQGKVGNPEAFIRRVKDACLRSGKQVTQDVDRIFVGVVASILGVHRVTEEHRAEKSARYPKQFIGTNDRIDAADQIDLVDVRYGGTEAGDAEIGRVRLIQVKNRELGEKDLAAIHRAHGAFHDKLAGVTDVERELLGREAGGRVISGEAYEMGMHAKSPEDRFEFERGYFRDFILNYLALRQEGSFDNATMQSWLGDEKPLAILKLRFGEERARTLFGVIAKGLASSPDQLKTVNALFNELRAWAVANPPTVEELRLLAPNLPTGIMKAASFESVVLHGAKTSTIDLPGFGEGKGLTQR